MLAALLRRKRVLLQSELRAAVCSLATRERSLACLQNSADSSQRRRSYSTSEQAGGELSGRGLVLGCYETKEGGYELTECAKDVDLSTQGRLVHLINVSGGVVKKGDSRLFYDVTPDHTHLAVVGMGTREPPAELVDSEDIDVARETVRIAAAVGTKVLQKAKVCEISLDDFNDSEACAEGCELSLFAFDKLKDVKKQQNKPTTKLISSSPSLLAGWERGSVAASAQNFARDLMESPANHMTPSLFVERVCRELGVVKEGLATGCTLEVIPRPLSWIESQKMGAFLAVAKGSAERPWFLELRYNYSSEADTKPVLLVGKGVTFDSGGISIKPAANMSLMRGDMGGAACVVATVMAIARLGLPLSVVAMVPLCENMPSSSAVKPGDVVTAMNGKTIEVDNTDAEGRLLLADALCHAHSYHPEAVIDLATLTGAIDVALGSGAAGVFSNSTALWTQLHRAGHVTGDRLWRMPLYSQYSEQIESHLADFSNIGKRGRSAGACTAAAFLKGFVQVPHWAHLDIAGVMESHGESPMLGKGLTGRPTRTLIQFLESRAKKVS